MKTTDVIRKYKEKLQEKMEGKFTLKDAEEYFFTTFDVIDEIIESDEDVKIPGWGKFFKKIQNSRKARNPQTGEEIDVPAKKKVGFKSYKKEEL